MVVPERLAVVSRLIALVLVVVAAAIPAPALAVTLPTLPVEFLDTTWAPPTGAVITVAPGGSLQTALNSAQLGDIIELQAGATYSGNFSLPNKTTGTGWIYIRSSAWASLPAPGTRVAPAQASLMAKVVTPNENPVFTTETSAHHYRFVGLEITVTAATSVTNYGLMSFDSAHYSGLTFISQTTLAQVPHDLVIDRCYIHGRPTAENIRGVLFNSARSAIVDSYVSDFHSLSADTQAVGGWNGPGPFKIVNNYLEAAAENVMFGGAAADVPNLVPSDIEIRRNYFRKPLSWKQGDPSFAGMAWIIKNLLEFKNAQRVLIEGNRFEDHWAQAQSGFFFTMTPRGEGGANPWATVSDITFRYNWVKRTTAGIAVSGTDGVVTTRAARVRVTDNIIENLGYYDVPGAFTGVAFMPTNGIIDFSVEHNTIFNESTDIYFIGLTSGTMTGFAFNNNILNARGYGILGDGVGGGPVTVLNTYAPGWIVLKNLFGGPWPTATGLTPSMFPAGNFEPASISDAGFTDAAGGNYALLASSPYKSAGTDGKDLGVDFAALSAALTGAMTVDTTAPSAPTGLTVF